MNRQAPETQAAGTASFPSSQPPENPPWNLIDVLAVFVFAAVSLFVTEWLVLFIAKSLPWFRKTPLNDLLQNAVIIVCVQTVASILAVAFMVQIIRLKKQDDFGTAISWGALALKSSLVAAAGGVALAFFSEVFTSLVYRWVPKSLPIDKLFRDANSAYVLAVYGIVVAPLVEELLFRGFLYPALARRFGVGASVIVTAALFAVIHQGQLAHAWAPLTWLFIVGVVLTLVRARTKSVAACVIVHVAYNATIFGVVFIASRGFHHID